MPAITGRRPIGRTRMRIHLAGLAATLALAWVLPEVAAAQAWSETRHV